MVPSEVIANRVSLAVRSALESTLPRTLLKVFAAGGDVAMRELPTLRGAEFDPDQPRDERGQWTSSGGFYHGTSRNRLDSIRREGLRADRPDKMWPDYTKGGLTYLSTDFDSAEAWAEHAASMDDTTDLVILEVKIPKEHVERLSRDVNFKHDDRQMQFKGDIPPEWIKSVKTARDVEGPDKGFRLWNRLRKHRAAAETDKTVYIVLSLSLDDELRTAKRKEPEKKRIGTFVMDLESPNSRAARWAREHVGWLIDGITQTTRERIQEAVAEAQESGDLRGQYKDILAAVGDEDRANVIARTESLTAANAGQREAWLQAVDEGLLPETARKVWIATPDEGVCPICEALDGEESDLDGEYPEPGMEGPPAHPNCRCTEGISGFRTAGGPGSGNFGHAGRPGEVGGSASDDIEVINTTSFDGNLNGIQIPPRERNQVYLVRYSKVDETKSPDGLGAWSHAHADVNVGISASAYYSRTKDTVDEKGFLRSAPHEGFIYIGRGNKREVIEKQASNRGRGNSGEREVLNALTKDNLDLVIDVRTGEKVFERKRAREGIRASGAPNLRACWRAAGGPGSGNFGHAGRPGEVGGSAVSENLESIADVSLPHDTEAYEYFYHAFDRLSTADAVENEGLKPGRSGSVFLSKDEIRDRGQGFAIVRVPKGQAEEGVDIIEQGLSYREFVVPAIPKEDVVRVVRFVPIGSGGHGIREDELAEYALKNPDADLQDLPVKYRKWFEKDEKK